MRRSPWPAVLLLITSIRLLMAWRMPLSADEAYYWVWSRALAPGYLDHPPMVALWIRGGTALLGQTPLGIRLFGPVSAALGTWLLARSAEDLAPGRRAGLAAGALLNGTLLLNVGAVILTPDTPLLFFWTAALFCLARLIRSGNGIWWLGVGLAGGLALDSKYTACLLGLALVVWLVAVPDARPWLRDWRLYVGGVLAAGVFAPVLLWNAAHHWVSFAKQGGRSADWAPARAAQFLGDVLAGQIGLVTPLILAACMLGVWRAGRQLGTAFGLLACVTLVPAAVFLEHALGDRVQANWPGIVYPGAILAAACTGVAFWRSAALSGVLLTVPVYAQAGWAPLALPRALDFTLIRLAGWGDLAGAVYVAAQQQGAGFVVADEYGLASELAFRLKMPVYGAEARWALFDLPVASPGGTGILVRSTRRAGPPGWPGAVAIGETSRSRHGITAETYVLYRIGAGPDAIRALPMAGGG